MFDIRQTKAEIIAAATVQNDRLVAAYVQIELMRAAFHEIANRASNMFDDDAADWLPSIYKIACDATGEDCSRMMAEYEKRNGTAITVSMPR